MVSTKLLPPDVEIPSPKAKTKMADQCMDYSESCCFNTFLQQCFHLMILQVGPN